MKILITEFMDGPAVAALAAAHETHYDPDLVLRRDELLARLADADALIVRNRTRVDEPLLAAASRLSVVGRLGVGLDNIDVDACQRRAVEVIPATGANALAVAEYVVAASMLLLRGAFGATAQVADGAWPRTALSDGRETHGRTLGLVGFGGIGRLVGRLGRALGMTVIAFDPALAPHAAAWRDEGVHPFPLDDVLARSDVVSLHVPLLPDTRRLIDGRRIAAMKPGAVLINTARGGVVDEAALATALRDGRLGGAALDVFEQEPLPAGSPLAGCPNLVLTPHVAGVTRESNARVSTLIAQKVLAHLASRAPGG